MAAAVASGIVLGQSPAQIQFTYDAAGNLVQATRLAQPDLIISNVAVGAITAQTSGAYAIPISFQVSNVGAGEATGTWTDRGYLSANSGFDDADEALGNAATRSVPLAPGASYTVNTTFTTATTTAAGSYTLFVKADGGSGAGQYAPTGPNVVSEFVESNNVQSAAVVLPPKLPDLAISIVTVGAIGVSQMGAYSVPVTITVTNVGSLAAQPDFYTLAYLSADGTLDNADASLTGYALRNTALAAGASYTVTQTFSTTTTTWPGSYTLLVKADGRGVAIGVGTNTDSGYVAEGSETNNTQAIALTLPAKPDLRVTAASVGAIAVNQAGAYSLPVTITVTNGGGTPALPNFYTLAYLSADATLDNGDASLTGYAQRNTVLAAGASYTVTQTYTTTSSTLPGNYTLLVKADGRGPAIGVGTNTDSGYVAEGSEANNAQAIALTLPAKPDLRVTAASVGAITVSQAGAYSLPVTFTVANDGGTPALPNFYTLAYLSGDGTLDSADANLTGYALRNTALAAGASYTTTQTYTTTTATLPGNYTLLVKADGRGPAIGVGTNTDGGYVAEGSEANNAQAVALTLPAKADLALSNVSVGTVVTNANGSRSIPVTFTVTNVGGAAAQPNFYTLAYLSADGALDNADANLTGYAPRNTALAAGASDTVTQTYTTTTATVPGNYTLLVKADGRGPAIGVGTNTDTGYLIETNEVNNVVGIPVVLP